MTSSFTNAFSPIGPRAISEIPQELHDGLNEEFSNAHGHLKMNGAPAVFLALTGDVDVAEAVSGGMDFDRLASWKGASSDRAGNCFYASTHGAIMLLANRPKTDFHLVTGRFINADGDGNAIMHAWIEVDDGRDGQALNLTNLSFRPGYIMDRETYLDLSRCDEVIQSVSKLDLRRAARAAVINPAKDWTNGERVRKFAKKLLWPTIEMSIDLIEDQDPGITP